jgi:hypothetical protein
MRAQARRPRYKLEQGGILWRACKIDTRDRALDQLRISRTLLMKHISCVLSLRGQWPTVMALAEHGSTVMAESLLWLQVVRYVALGEGIYVRI